MYMSSKQRGLNLCRRYLHFLRHYNDKRIEAGYHKLDKSKIPSIDEAVEDLREMELTLHKYKREMKSVQHF